MNRIQVGDNQLPLPKIVSGSAFTYQQKWNVKSVKGFLNRKGYNIESYTKNGKVPFWKTLHDSYISDNPDSYLTQVSEKAKIFNYDFHEMFDNAYTQIDESPIFFHYIENVKKDSLTYDIRKSGNRNRRYDNDDYCQHSYQALLQHIHSNGLNKGIVDSMTLVDAYSCAGMVEDGYNNKFLGNRDEAFETFLSIGISREKTQELKKTKIAHLKEFGERIAWPKHLLLESYINKNHLGNPTDNNFYTSLYDTLLEKGKKIRRHYHDKS